MTTSPLLEENRSPQWQPARQSLLGAGILGAIALFVVASALALLDHIAPSLPLAIAGGLGLTFLVALSVARYEVAVFLGFLLSGVVRIEPAPPDGVFAVVMAVAIVTGRLRVDRLPAPVAFALAALTALNVLSFAAAYSISDGVRFASITLYCSCSASGSRATPIVRAAAARSSSPGSSSPCSPRWPAVSRSSCRDSRGGSSSS